MRGRYLHHKAPRAGHSSLLDYRLGSVTSKKEAEPFMSDYKHNFLLSLLTPFKDKPIRLLDMGAGSSTSFISILPSFPQLEYFSVEQDSESLAAAKKNLSQFSKVTFINDFGENLSKKYTNFFDITISLSVLEHVKHLENFLESSVLVTKAGGLIVHRYDLGHSLHANFAERLKVKLCEHLPFLFPASYFTTHPKQDIVVAMLRALGADVKEVTQSQMPNLKNLMNLLYGSATASQVISDKIVDLEKTVFDYLKDRVDTQLLEEFLPTITLTAIKKI